MDKENKPKLPAVIGNLKSYSKETTSLVKDALYSIDAEQGTRIFLNMLPWIGGALGQLVYGNKDKRELEKIKSFISMLVLNLNNVLEEKIDKEYFKSEEFYILIKKVLNRIKYESREEKLMMFSSFLIKCAFKDVDLKINKEYLLDKLELVQLEHFKIMQYYLDKGYTRVGSLGCIYDSRGGDLSQIAEHFDVYETDLVNFGFFQITQTGGGNKNRYMLIPLGIEFLKFVNFEGNDEINK